MWQKSRSDQDFSEEIRAHLDLETDRLIESGLPPEEAHALARRRFGNVLRAEEQAYESTRWIWLTQALQDVRYGWRSLRHSPAFLLTTTLTLAVGLALVTVAFSLFNAYVLRPFAVHDPYQLHLVGWRAQDSGRQFFPWRDYDAFSGRRDVFDAVIAEHGRTLSLDDGRALTSGFVSANYFEALGVRARYGRVFSIDDASEITGPVAVVLSDAGWRRFFGADTNVVGRSFDIGRTHGVIVGVIQGNFAGLDDQPRDAWLLMHAAADPGTTAADLADQSVRIIGRLRSAVTADQANAALTPLVASLIEPAQAVRAPVRAEVVQHATPNPLSLELIAVVAPIFAAFVLVLLTVCANVSNIMLARGNVRHREMAVRLSIGASRGRVVRQLMIEGLLLALIAGSVGLALAALVSRVGASLFLTAIPPAAAAMIRIVPLDFDVRVFVFVFGVAGFATVLFALVPALHATNLSLVPALRGELRSGVGSSRTRSVLVAGQTAVAMLLLVVAVTLVRNGMALAATELGFDPRGVVSINTRDDTDTRGAIASLAHQLLDDPRVGTVAVTSTNPLFERMRAVAAGPDDTDRAAGRTRYTFVSPDYFELLGIPIVQGRAFSSAEGASAARVAVVSAATARAFWPEGSAIGRPIRIESAGDRAVDDVPGYDVVTVVGVADDVVSGMLFDGADASHLYLPIHADDPHAAALLVGGRQGADFTPDHLRAIISTVDGDAHVYEAIPLDDMLTLQLFPLRAAAAIGVLLSGIALFLAVTGLYGVMSYTVSQRAREIAIRMALGATVGNVVRLVVTQSTRLAGLGAMVGLMLAGAALTFLASVVRLENVSVLDVSAFTIAVAVVVMATLMASYVPTRRAALVNPAATLRRDA